MLFYSMASLKASTALAERYIRAATPYVDEIF